MMVEWTWPSLPLDFVTSRLLTAADSPPAELSVQGRRLTERPSEPSAPLAESRLVAPPLAPWWPQAKRSPKQCKDTLERTKLHAGDSCSLVEMLTRRRPCPVHWNSNETSHGLPPEPPEPSEGSGRSGHASVRVWLSGRSASFPGGNADSGRHSGVRGRRGSLRKNLYLPDSSQVSPTFQGRSQVLHETSWMLQPSGWSPGPLASPERGRTGVRSPNGL